MSGADSQVRAHRPDVSYATARAYVSKNGLPTKRPGMVSSRPYEIMEDVRATGNLTKTAKKYNVSKERVRQIIARDEARGASHYTRGVVVRLPKQRVTQVCVGGCGKTQEVTPGRARAKPVWRCTGCYDGGSKLPKTIDITRAAEYRRLEGLPWADVATKYGYDPRQPQVLIRTLFMRLQAAGEHYLIAQLWPNGIPHWLKRYVKE